MKIEMAYRNGKVDAFDTMSFTAPSPLEKGNALTNFELRFDELGKRDCGLPSVIMTSTPQAPRNALATKRVARRRRGWRFLLAEASEVAELESVAMDGEGVLARILGEMVDMAQLKRSASLWLGSSGLSIAETIVRLFDELLVVSQVDEGMLPDAVPRLCGCSEELVYRLKAVSPHQSGDEEETNEQEENWLKGFED